MSLREQIYNLIKKDFIGYWLLGIPTRWLINKILSLITKRVKGIENPYKKLTAQQIAKSPQDMCELEVGFGDAIQAVIKELEDT